MSEVRFDIAPGFWAWLGQQSLVEEVASVGAVKEEIAAGSGALVGWARARPGTFWLPETDESLAAMRRLSGWANDSAHEYRREAVDEFLNSADYVLIAHAIAIQATVVTRERSAPESKKKVKIPDVCNAFGVRWTDPFTLYRTLGLRLAG